MSKKFIRCSDIPPEAWKLALGRTDGLAIDRLAWDSDLKNLVANAYLQGVTDVGNNMHLIRRILDEADAPEPGDHYQGA